jgi:hypothetical protein
MAITMLSLVSNPHDPFKDFLSWWHYDRDEGFDTAGFLARCVSTSSELSESDQELAVEQAIDDILANPAFDGLYKKVYRHASDAA